MLLALTKKIYKIMVGAKSSILKLCTTKYNHNLGYVRVLLGNAINKGS